MRTAIAVLRAGVFGLALAITAGCATTPVPTEPPANATPAPTTAQAGTPAELAPVPEPIPLLAGEPEIAKVVWHVDFADPRRFSAMIQNVNNMVTTYQSELMDYDVRIVFLAGGIRFVTEDALAGTPFEEDDAYRERRDELIQRLQQLREIQGVKLELCEITREMVGLPSESIIAGVEPVRSGVVRIAELQSQGFAYLKVE